MTAPADRQPLPGPPATPVRAELFGPGRRAATVGLLLLTVVTAFEAMGVGTAMPAVIADIDVINPEKFEEYRKARVPLLSERSLLFAAVKSKASKALA